MPKFFETSPAGHNLMGNVAINYNQNKDKPRLAARAA